MKDADLAELERLLAQATPGPWHAPGLAEVHDSEHRVIALCSDVDPVDQGERPHPTTEEGEHISALIVAAVNALPRLIAALREARALPPQGWVAVGEREPPTGQRVLIYEPAVRPAGPAVTIGVRYVPKRLQEGGWSDLYGEDVGVSHWMPLPPATDRRRRRAAGAKRMNREQIEAWVREVLPACETEWNGGPQKAYVFTADELARFADLVAAAERARCITHIYAQCGSDNVAQRTVDAIRAQPSEGQGQ